MANFIRDNVICRLGIPNQIISDSGTPFVNTYVRQLIEEYGVGHIKSNLYYPQGNSQPKATNRTLLQILSRMFYEEPKRRADVFPLVLWAYRTSKRTSTQPFSLIYGAETMVPINGMVLSTHLAIESKLTDSHDCINDIKALDERRHNAEHRWLSYQKYIRKTYNKKAIPWTFCIGDSVLKATGHV